ncbi:MAG TPA: Phenylacetic acid catabolic protein [Longimicrobium sp.]|nr:Phenylacetic acid catabolic protein [Longimicrobium sp.]
MTETRIDKAAELPDDARAALRALILSLADSKRVQGLRYSDRMLGAPTLEAGIAASSMAQDEWGHARLTYALLGEFGDDPKGLEHARPAAEYQSHPALDAEFGSWSDFIACMLLVDTALATQYGALVGSRYTPVQNRVQKMLDEERFHFQYAAGWTRKIAAVAELRDDLAASMGRYLGPALQWLGDDSAPAARRLVEEGLMTGDPSALRARFLAKVGPVLEDAGLAAGLGLSRDGDAWTYGGSLSWDGWNESTRRSGGALDETVAARARGDKNRALLLD